MAGDKAHIELYTAGTPNGQKASCLLEELGLDYTTHHVDITKNTQKEPWFLAINPNGRIPAIVDTTGGASRRIFESGALMQYLVDRYDKANKISFAYDSDDYWEAVAWLTFAQSGIGPMQGQSNHFYRYAPEKIEYGINRYQTEVKRLYEVLETRLAEQESQGRGLWTVGGKYTYVDLNMFCWVNWAEWAGVDTNPFPKIEKWLAAIDARPPVQRGLNVPEPFKMKEKMKSKEGEAEFAKHHGDWVMKGQTDNQKRLA